MNDRDKDLDEILAPLRKKSASAAQVHEWGEAMRAASDRKGVVRWLVPRVEALPQIAAALFVGFLFGMFVIKGGADDARESEKNIYASATIEEIYAKAE